MTFLLLVKIGGIKSHPLCIIYKEGGGKFFPPNFILVKKKVIVVKKPQFHFQFASHFYYTII